MSSRRPMSEGTQVVQSPTFRLSVSQRATWRLNSELPEGHWIFQRWTLDVGLNSLDVEIKRKL